jgi:hypothetical protein
MGESSSKLSSGQFTIARLMGCMLLAALAAWCVAVKLPVTLTVSSLGNRDVLPFVLASLLLAAAVGVLARGRPGAISGTRLGCAVVIALAMFGPVCLGMWDLGRWLR